MKCGVARKVSLYVGGLGSGSWKSHDIESRRTFSKGVVVVVSNVMDFAGVSLFRQEAS